MVCFTSFNPPVLPEQSLGPSCLTFLGRSAKIGSAYGPCVMAEVTGFTSPLNPRCLFTSTFIWCAGREQRPDVKDE